MKVTYLTLTLLSVVITIGFTEPWYLKRNNKLNVDEIFKVSRDTIYLKIEGDLLWATLINNRYYALYGDGSASVNPSPQRFYIISKGGKTIKSINVPKAIYNDPNYHLYYWHDHFNLVNTKYYKTSYYFDEHLGRFFKSARILNIPLFEDGHYVVTKACYGEFGGALYFKNKKTVDVSSVNCSGCPFAIITLNNKYIVDASWMEESEIIEIEDSNSLSYRNVFFSNGFKWRFNIVGSFVNNGVLYTIFNALPADNHFYNNQNNNTEMLPDTVKIGILDKGKLKTVYTFNNNFHINFVRQISANYQVFTFYEQSDQSVNDVVSYEKRKYGVIEIKDNEIKIHYFVREKAG